jgi:hypothetical protein
MRLPRKGHWQPTGAPATRWAKSGLDPAQCVFLYSWVRDNCKQATANTAWEGQANHGRKPARSSTTSSVLECMACVT